MRSENCCCVGGCNATRETRLFSFPKNDGLRKLWISFLSPTNSLLKGLTKEQLRKKRVCEKHFDKHQFDHEGRRLRYSYPCLFTAEEIAHGVPLSAASSAKQDVSLEHNYYKAQDEEDVTKISPVMDTTDTQMFDEHLPSDSPVPTFAIDTEDNDTQNSDEHFSSCSPVPTYAIVTENTDVILEQPSCSGMGNNTEVVMDTKQTFQIIETPKQKHSTLRKFGSKKFIKHVTEMSANSSGDSASERLTQAVNINQQQLLDKFNLLNKQAQTFLLMQLKQVQKSKMARRFTLDEKLLSLLLMKQSPNGYKLLENMFALPNKRTLLRLSEKVSMEPGLNAQIFEKVSQNCKNWDTKQKLCTIVFDEVALTPHLTDNKNKKKDKSVRFVDIAGEEWELKYRDHALVFMLRGICSPWQQIVAYNFGKGKVSAHELQTILKQVVSQVALTGLIPMGLVCDQGSTFRRALKILREYTITNRNIEGAHDDGSVNLEGHDISIFYDPPHLLKGFRNNFATKDIIWNGKTASWKDIEFVYNVDSKLGHPKALPKLTAQHVNRKKNKKMKVSVAAQVLSARMAAMLKYTNAVNKLHGADNGGTMATTAEVVELFDNIFDSVNGYPDGSKKGTLRQAIKKDSQHHSFWLDAVEKIKSFYFIDKFSKHAVLSGKSRFIKVPSLQGWVTTLESFIRMSKLLFDNYGVDCYYPRYINKDPLEIFFGRMRGLNYRNTNPDANAFVQAFKSSLISNVLSPHSGNCEEDDGEALLNVNCLFDNSNLNKENCALHNDGTTPGFANIM